MDSDFARELIKGGTLEGINRSVLYNRYIVEHDESKFCQCATKILCSILVRQVARNGELLATL